MMMFMVKPAADSKIRQTPTQIAVPPETESNEFADIRFINAACLPVALIYEIKCLIL
jgi:hypothetical protein